MGYYFVNIGRNDKNVGGTGARGYWIRRSGPVVRRTGGAVDVEGSNGGRFFWRGQPRETIDHLRSPDEARRFVERKLREKLRHANGGYQRLPPSNKIH